MWQFSQREDNEQHSFLFRLCGKGFCALRYLISIRVWGIASFIHVKVSHNLLSDKRNNLTLSFCTNPSLEVGGNETFINQLNNNIMKKILLFMLPLVALSFASCEKDNGGNEEELSGDDIIQFKDPNFLKALLYVQEINIYDPDNFAADYDGYVQYTVDVDRNRDGQISVNEAQDVIALGLYNYEEDESFNILSMPEIKYFTSLEYLSCYENQLTSLDVSNNTALEYLDCYGNQLTSLDVSNNTALTDLSCDGNKLTSLDVSKNTALTDLNCDFNELTSLDVSNNTALTSLDCEENQLTSLDVSKNTALTDLYCSGNPLQKLILYRHHLLNHFSIDAIESEYGDIIEYVE